jgi:protein tyrosine phosphatase (PTP) superfamily phosphohydrolase (DUF442 family)
MQQVFRKFSIKSSLLALTVTALSGSIASAEVESSLIKAPASQTSEPAEKSAFSATFADLLNQSAVPPANSAVVPREKVSEPNSSTSTTATKSPQYGKPLEDSLEQEARAHRGQGLGTSPDAAAPAAAAAATTMAPFTRGGGAFAPLHGIQLPRPVNIPANSCPSLKEAAAMIPNFSVVSPKLMRGSQPPSSAFPLLKAAGVRTIVNLRNEDILVAKEAGEAKRAGLDYVNIPMTLFVSPTRQQFLQFMSTVNNAGPVFVHCQKGEDRTGTMVAVYRITNEKWDPNRAYQEMTAMGFKTYLGALSGSVYDYSADLGRSGRRPIPDFSGFTSILKH